jgi:hypothetical protein
MAYTAFGERRKGDWRVSDPLLPIIPALTNRGFTGHEPDTISNTFISLAWTLVDNAKPINPPAITKL